MMPAALSLSAAGLIFGVVALGLAWPLVARTTLDPAEKLVAGATLSLLGVFLLGWAGFVAKLPVGWHWILPALAVAGLAARRADLAALWRDPAARELLFSQVLVSVWGLAWLAWVKSYSGGGWAGDWFEHWDRARFILERGPPDTLFLGHATVTARPPLANVVSAVFLSLTRVDFAHYQLLSALFGSLAFAPAALFARRLGGSAAIPVAALLFMLNPMFVQNTTFAWTKLPTAFFVLGAVWFFLRTATAPHPRRPALLFAATLAAAILTHYSAGPFAVVLAAAWLIRSLARRAEPAWWRATAGAAVLGAILLATWFGWALVVYGAGGTLLANTSVQTADATAAGQLGRIALNLRDTLVPHFLRPLDSALIAQTSPWGAWRDWAFQSYQTNLLFAFGSVAWLALAAVQRRIWAATDRGVRLGWAAAVGAAVVLGVAVHGARDTWGLTHICLQPVVLLGLAALGGCAASLAPPWRRLLVAGAAIDFALGLFLHYGVQQLAFDRWFAPGRPLAATFATYNQVAGMNLAAKAQLRAVFFYDTIALPFGLLAAAVLALLALGVWRLRIRLTHAR
jgi:hypothetical protein